MNTIDDYKTMPLPNAARNYICQRGKVERLRSEAVAADNVYREQYNQLEEMEKIIAGRLQGDCVLAEYSMGRVALTAENNGFGEPCRLVVRELAT